jgi:hypothetical protein
MENISPGGTGPNQESDPTLNALTELLSTFGIPAAEEKVTEFSQALADIDPRILPRREVTHLLREHVEGAASGDQTRRIEAYRFLGALMDYVHERDDNYSQTGLDAPLSGEEAYSGIVDVLGQLEGDVSDSIRQGCKLPNTPRPDDPHPVFKDDEHDIAAYILGIWLRVSCISDERAEWITLQKLAGTDKSRELILGAILREETLVRNTPEQTKDIFGRIMEKLPYILQRSILEQRKTKTYLKRELDEL